MNKNKNGELGLPDQEKAEAIRILRTGTDDAKFLELNTWIKTCRHLPTHAKSGDHKSRITFAVEGVMSHKWKKEAPCYAAVGGGTDIAGRIQEEGQD